MITEKDILHETHYGLNIYAYILREYYPDEIVIRLSGKECAPALALKRCLIFCRWYLLLFLSGFPGQIICVPFTCLRPRYPLSTIPVSGLCPVILSTCASWGARVSPSKGFPKKLMIPIIIPDFRVFVIDTLFPNSYFLFSLPLAIQLTCGW